MTSKRRGLLAFVLLWAGAIFATSCTVVTTDQLFAIVGWLVGPSLLQRFELFWGVVWFIVVKSWHAIEFAVLTAGLIALLNVWRPSRPQQNILMAAVMAILFAASDEFHQTYVPNRGGTVWDVLIDSIGVSLVTLFALVRHRHQQTASRSGIA